jgi:hypothetical protein
MCFRGLTISLRSLPSLCETHLEPVELVGSGVWGMASEWLSSEA